MPISRGLKALVLWPLALVQSLQRKREFLMGKSLVILYGGRKRLFSERELVGPGTEVSSSMLVVER